MGERRCGKVAHETAESAWDHVRRIKRTRGSHKGKPLDRLGAYHCPYCGYYHVGHADPSLRKAKRAMEADHRAHQSTQA